MKNRAIYFASDIHLNHHPIKMLYFLIDRKMGRIPHPSSLIFVKCLYPNPNPNPNPEHHLLVSVFNQLGWEGLRVGREQLDPTILKRG